MKKRSCKRFSIPGTTLYYRYRKSIFKKPQYSQDYFPVTNLSRGGAQFLCNERLKPGKALVIKIIIPGEDTPLEIKAEIRWISRNREESYLYQTGISFNSYGSTRKENPALILDKLKTLEEKAGMAD